MSSSKKFGSKEAPSKNTRRQRKLKKMGLSAEKYFYTHSWDQVYKAWSGATPDFAKFTKLHGVNPPELKSNGLWMFSMSEYAHVLYYPISKGFTMVGDVDLRRLVIPHLEKWIFENAHSAEFEEHNSPNSSDNSDTDTENEPQTGSLSKDLVSEQIRLTQLVADKFLLTENTDKNGVVTVAKVSTSISSTNKSTDVTSASSSTTTHTHTPSNTEAKKLHVQDRDTLAALAGFADEFVAKYGKMHTAQQPVSSTVTGTPNKTLVPLTQATLQLIHTSPIPSPTSTVGVGGYVSTTLPPIHF